MRTSAGGNTKTGNSASPTITAAMTVLNTYAKDRHGHEERKNRKGLPAIARQTEPLSATLNTLRSGGISRTGP
jgi:hypothetical protein